VGDRPVGQAACRIRQEHRLTVKRAERCRKDQRGLRVTIQDDGPEKIYLTNAARGRCHLSRRPLLGAKIRLNDHGLVILIDSGCEVALALSRYLADKIGIAYSFIPREFGLLDGTRMAVARTFTVSLDIAGSRKEPTSVVVDMVAFDCILGLPWLDTAKPVVNCKTRRMLLPGIYGF
jgi:predicted aspartyl protease